MKLSKWRKIIWSNLGINYMVLLFHKCQPHESLPDSLRWKPTFAFLCKAQFWVVMSPISIMHCGVYLRISNWTFFQINSKNGKKYLKHFMKHCLIQIITYSNSFEFCDSTTDYLPLSWMKRLSNGSCTVLQAHMIE